ncbi:tyrosine-type recombinase/integrase [Sphingomonas sp. XXL09]|uniref:tyrosine-type recombinase/integrase n=1 Tax=Sphingomonas sp. XXL09 TaxID=3457787 RepID=UPI00406BC7BB
MLNNAVVKAARPRAAAYKLTDAGGLHLYVAPTGLRSWRWRFRIDGREQLLTIGSFPDVSLDQARSRRDGAAAARARGEDPRAVSTVGDIGGPRTFEEEARRWYQHMLPRWTEVHAGDVLASLDRDVFPAIGAMPIGAITPPVVLNAMRSVEQRGRRETARRICQRISAVFRFAIAEGIVDNDPAQHVGRALMPPRPARRQPALLRAAEARELLNAVDQLGGADIIKAASRFLALTAVRLAAVRGACWDEIEDLDGDAPLWRVPAARMKLARAKKDDAANDHLVPLSRQAAQLLRSLRTSSNDSGLIFAGRAGGQMGEAAIGALYARAGFTGRHVPHGWRATFATVLNELQPEARSAIDRALAHAPKDKVEAAYNRAELLERRRDLFQAWADQLDA